MVALALALLAAAQAPVVAGLGAPRSDRPAFDTAAAPAVEPLVDADGVKGLRATFLVAAPPDRVLETLWDVRRFRSIFPDIESLEVLAASDSSVDARFFVDAVFTKVSYTLRRDVDRGRRTVTWRSIGGDVKLVRGSWSVAPTADASVSRVTYTSFVDIGAVVPTGMVRDVAMGKVEQMTARVRAACQGAP
jgi:ribosome-associated toxin RatA of RatAB toxin-antitoxin module